MVTIGVRIEPDACDQQQRIAQARGLTLCALVRDVLRRKLTAGSGRLTVARAAINRGWGAGFLPRVRSPASLCSTQYCLRNSAEAVSVGPIIRTRSSAITSASCGALNSARNCVAGSSRNTAFEWSTI